ncbi:hypothetical protein C8N46_105248 [Kordia periserrulae]|uniref:Uncharacterized protein n=1 Tax=Kordia periserrulae TaxID=701523 RepID=A0A2T6BYE4_9FLAO|nr:hypothetical protein [Kordia periserrulae]PTX61092.1 hypothetical protein C8N46_105248 [Kordia periserrulae]
MKKKKVTKLKIEKLKISDMNPELLRGGKRSDWTELSECCKDE